MEGKGIEEKPVFEIGIVLPKRVEKGDNGNGDGDCVEVLAVELKKMGLMVDRVVGLQNEFLRVGSILFLSFCSDCLATDPYILHYSRKFACNCNTHFFSHLISWQHS